MGYIIRDGVIYGGGGGSADGDNIFHGTQAEWEQLSSTEKAEYDFAAFTDDYDPSSITNPNLLDNPWFTVNQRGAAIYSGSTYCVDRWRSWETGDNVVNSDGVLVERQIGQVIDNSVVEKILDRNVTISMLYGNGKILSTTGKIHADSTSTTDIGIEEAGVINLILYDFVDSGTGTHIYSVQANVLGNTPVQIRAIKLELGSVSTLAMDTAPNYATELLKCQRYCVVLGGNYQLFGMGYSEGTSYIDMTYPLPVRMRTTPTLSMPDGVALCYGHTGAMSNYNYFTSITTVFDGGATKGNNCAFRCVASDLVGDQMYKIGTKDRKVILSADL